MLAAIAVYVYVLLAGGNVDRALAEESNELETVAPSIVMTDGQSSIGNQNEVTRPMLPEGPKLFRPMPTMPW